MGLVSRRTAKSEFYKLLIAVDQPVHSPKPGHQKQLHAPAAKVLCKQNVVILEKKKAA